MRAIFLVLNELVASRDDPRAAAGCMTALLCSVTTCATFDNPLLHGLHGARTSARRSRQFRTEGLGQGRGAEAHGATVLAEIAEGAARRLGAGPWFARAFMRARRGAGEAVGGSSSGSAVGSCASLRQLPPLKSVSS